MINKLLKKSELGSEYGILKVIELNASKIKSQRCHKCLCKCGTIKNIRESSLIRGLTKSCGCKNRFPGIKDIKIGDIFGYWKVLELNSMIKDHKYHKCICICGKIKTVRPLHLMKKISSSCGCIFKTGKSRKTRGGEGGSRMYHIWYNMNARCSLTTKQDNINYAGRGIKVCDEWKDYLIFKEWALNNGYKENLTLDRINNDGNYTPDNCRWANIDTQNWNRRCSRWQLEYYI